MVQDEDGIAEPYVGMEFDSEDAAKTFYDEYARVVGFSSKVGHLSRSKPTGTIISQEFVCGGEGSKMKSSDSCDAVLGIELKGQNKWVVTKFIKEHNHSLMSPSKVHDLRPHRHFSGAAKTMAESYQEWELYLVVSCMYPWMEIVPLLRQITMAFEILLQLN